MARTLRIGLVGRGFIAKCHVIGYRAVPLVFPEASAFPSLEIVADMDEASADAARQRFGFARHAGN